MRSRISDSAWRSIRSLSRCVPLVFSSPSISHRVAQQRAQVIGQIGGDAVVPHEQPQPSLRVDDVALGTVVDGVALACLSLLEVDLEFLRDLLGCRQVAAQAEETQVEGGDVLRQRLLRVALRVDADHQDLDALGIRAELLHGAGDFRERGRADVRAVREAEEQHHDLPPPILQPPRLAGMVGELERIPVGRPGDVGALELRPAAVAAGEQRKAKDNGRREAQRTARPSRQSSTGRSFARPRRCRRGRCATRKPGRCRPGPARREGRARRSCGSRRA